jgi:putative transcriptional regulator
MISTGPKQERRHAAGAAESGRKIGRGAARRRRAGDFARPARNRGGRAQRGRNAARSAEARGSEDASYARNVRGRTGLTQSAFAARIGVPVETVRNWEQGKRSPRGPARALLKVLEEAPDAAFAVLGGKRR